MNNRITLKLGGVNRELLYDFGTLEHIENITGQDPMNFAFDVKEHKSFKEGSLVLIYAGLLSSYDEKGKAADFSKEDVQKWMKRLSIGDILRAINAWGEAKKTKASGEEAPNTQEKDA